MRLELALSKVAFNWTVKVDLWISKKRPIVDIRRRVCKVVYVRIFVFIRACVYLCSFMRVYMCKGRQVSGRSRKVNYTRMCEEGV